MSTLLEISHEIEMRVENQVHQGRCKTWFIAKASAGEERARNSQTAKGQSNANRSIKIRYGQTAQEDRKRNEGGRSQ